MSEPVEYCPCDVYLASLASPAEDVLLRPKYPPGWRGVVLRLADCLMFLATL